MKKTAIALLVLCCCATAGAVEDPNTLLIPASRFSGRCAICWSSDSPSMKAIEMNVWPSAWSIQGDGVNFPGGYKKRV